MKVNVKPAITNKPKKSKNQPKKQKQPKQDGLKKVYVITGSPIGGKTDILNELRQKGFNVMHEVTRKVTDETDEYQGGSGSSSLLKEIKRFQTLLFEAQAKEEALFPEEVVFVDRGIGDIIAYCDIYGIQPPREMAEKRAGSKGYHRVILLERLANYEKDGTVKEGYETAEKLQYAMEMVYKKLGYQIIKVPPLPKKERMQWLLKELGMDTSKSGEQN